MFKCQNEFCGKQVPPRQPVNRIVTERRNTTYEKKIIKRRKVVDIIEIQGWEIVKEICVCPKCFTKLTGKQPKLISPQQQKPQTRRVRGFNERPPGRRKWQNPKQKRDGTTGSQKSHQDHSKSQTSKSSTSTTKKPIVVEKINPIPVIKE